MAEGLARDIFGGKVNVLSAGSAPAKVNPYAVQVMAENGIDLSRHTSKSVDDIDLSTIDLIITLCADEVCPVVHTRTKRLHWPLADPATNDPKISKDQLLVRFRTAHDEISAKLSKLNLNILD